MMFQKVQVLRHPKIILKKIVFVNFRRGVHKNLFQIKGCELQLLKNNFIRQVHNSTLY